MSEKDFDKGYKSGFKFGKEIANEEHIKQFEAMREKIQDRINKWEHRIETRENNECYHDETDTITALTNQIVGMNFSIELIEEYIEKAKE